MNTRAAALSLVAAALAALTSCSRGQLAFTQGACEPGQVEVGNTCVVVVGRQCETDGTCFGGTCITDGDVRYCSTACDDDTGCPMNYVCNSAGARSYCRKDRGVLPGRCRTDADCPACSICTQGVCRPNTVCVQVLCKADVDCGSCKKCQGGVCKEIKDCGPSCLSSADCQPDQVCTFDYQGALACLPRTGGVFSAPCTMQTGVQCESGICLSGEGVGGVYDTYCSMGCTDAVHSADCPPGFRCRPYPPFGGGSDYCVLERRDFPTDCASRYDCDNGLICRYAVAKDQKHVVTYCAEGVPDGRGLGSSCGATAPCATGLCPETGNCTTPCAADNDCPEAYNCLPLKTEQFSTQQIDFNGCVYYTFVRGGQGDRCPGGDDDCESGLCVSGDTGGPIARCAVACQAGAAACPQFFACDTLPDGTSACVFDPYRGGCSADADCGTGSACASDEASGSLYPACRAIKGDEGAPGGACAVGTSLTCTSGICLGDNLCSAFCRTGADCPQGFVCDYGLLGIDPHDASQEIVVMACIPDPGSLAFCAHDRGCPAADEVCRAFIWDRTGEVRTWCRKARPSWKSAGEPCTDNGECAGGVCLGNTTCTQVCATDTDCGAGEVCSSVAYYLTESYARPVRACRPAPKSDETGQGCVDDTGCQSGYCYGGPDGQMFCTEKCRDHRDCEQSYTVCRFEPANVVICTPADYRPVE